MKQIGRATPINHLLPSIDALLRRLAENGGSECYFENQEPESIFGPGTQAAIDNGYIIIDTCATAGFHNGLVMTEKGWQAIGLEPPLSLLRGLAWTIIRFCYS